MRVNIVAIILCLVAGTMAAGLAYMVYWDCCTPEGRAGDARRAQQVQDDKLPRKTSEANGCEVWAFKPHDRWLYFTRCGDRTVTQNTWETCRQTIPGKPHTNTCTQHVLPIEQGPK